MIVYITTNLINGKKYIGSHANDNPEYLGSGVYLKKAIQKYGKDKFVRELLVESNQIHSIEEMKELEMYYIDYYNAYKSPLFYNQTKYAAGISKVSEEHKLKVSEANKGHKYNLGRKQSAETIQKRVSKIKGQKFSQESKDKIGKSKIGNSYALGNKFTKEQKQKISDAKKGHKCYLDPNRSNNVRKSITQYDLQNNFIKEWNSISDATRFLGIRASSLHYGLQTSRPCHRFIWKYKI